MAEARLPVAERADERDVLRRVRQVVLAADDVGDLHGLVVDDHHEVVQGHAIGADDHEVTQQAVVELDLAADQVVEADDLGLDLEANDRWPLLGLECGALRIGQVQAATVVARRLLGRFLLTADGLQLLGRAPAPIRCAALEQPLRLSRIEVHSSALPVRSVWPDVLALGDLRSLVPADAEPVEVVDDVPLELGRASRDVGVLDAQDIGASHVPSGEEVVEARCAPCRCGAGPWDWAPCARGSARSMPRC